MSGVRMGERALQIAIDDPEIAGTIAAKVGLSGHAAIAVSDEAAATTARNAAAKAGALVDVHAGPLHAIPVSNDSFDVIVVNARSGWLTTLDESSRAAILRETFRIVRPGGRIVAIEGAQGVAVEALATAGFKAARVLAERDGYRFTEGLKPRS